MKESPSQSYLVLMSMVEAPQRPWNADLVSCSRCPQALWRTPESTKRMEQGRMLPLCSDCAQENRFRRQVVTVAEAQQALARASLSR